MTRTQIREKLGDLIGKTDGDSDAESAEDVFFRLGDAAAFDSVSALQLVFDIEEHFKITVADEDIHPDNFHSLDALADYIERKVSEIFKER
ncbi:MAG: acyl carrier protein [Candidatus Binatia bacterium]